MTRPNPKPFFPLPGEIDTRSLAAYLTEQGIDRQRRDEMIKKVINAILRYGQPYVYTRLKSRLENAAKAARELRQSMPKLGTLEYVEFLNAIEGTFPKEELYECDTDIGIIKYTKPLFDEANDRLRKFFELPATLEMLEAAANERLAEIAQPGHPSTKIKPARELKEIWERGTGKPAGASGFGKFKNPRSYFGDFVKLCVEMMPNYKEFETDFGGLLIRALRDGVSKPAPKI
jgi:hypothetical protein